jgi:hypothetical protein
MSNLPQHAEIDWATVLDPAYQSPPAVAPQPPPQPPLEEGPVATADEILERHAASFGITRAQLMAGLDAGAAPQAGPPTGVVFTDGHRPASASTPMAPSVPDSPEVIELLRAIHAELRSIGGMLAAGINKMPPKRGAKP